MASDSLSKVVRKQLSMRFRPLFEILEALTSFPSRPPPDASSLHCSVINVLFVCTANQCRSPMAEAIFRSLLVDRGIDWPVSSVGVLEAGHPMVEEALAALGRDGAAMTNHLSRTLSKSDAIVADIIFGMAREHVREVVVLDPEAWGKTFTLKEFVRRTETFPPWFPERPFVTWLASIHQGRQRDDMQGDSLEDDVADPIGGTPANFAATAGLLRDLCGKVADRVAPRPTGSRGMQR